MKFFSNFFLVVLLLLVISVLGLIVLSQQTGFRSFITERTLEVVNKNIHGSLAVGKLEGDLVTGFVIHDVLVKDAHGDTAIVIPTFLVRFNPIALLGGDIKLWHVVLSEPTFTLVRDSTGTLNLAKIFTSNDTATTLFTGRIDIRSFIVDNAHVIFRSESHPQDAANGRDQVDYNHLDIKNISMNASVVIAKKNIVLDIAHLSAALPANDIVVEEFFGVLSHTDSLTSIENVRILTSRSDITLSASMRKKDPFTIVSMGDLYEVPVTFNVKGKRISIAELKKFIPSLRDLGGSVAVIVEGAGTYSNIEVKHFDFARGKSLLSLTGYVTRLDEPAKLAFDVKANESVLTIEDIAPLFPEIDFKPYKKFHTTTISSGSFRGTSTSFSGTVDLATSAGSVRGDVSYLIRNTTPKYSASLHAKDFDISPFLRDTVTTSSLTGAVTLEGEGDNSKNINTTVRLALESSRIKNVIVRSILGTLHLKGSFLRADTLGIIFNDGSAMAVSGWLDRSDTHAPAFDVAASATSLNVAALSGDSTQRSSLSLTMAASGRGGSLDELTSTAVMNVSKFVVGSKIFPPMSLNAQLSSNKDDGSHSLEITSTLANVSLVGKYRPSTLIPIIVRKAQAIGRYVETRVDRIRGIPTTSTFSAIVPPEEVIDARLDVDIRSLDPVVFVQGETSTRATGTLGATIKGTAEMLSVDIKGDVRNLVVREKSQVGPDYTYVQLSPLAYTLTLQDLTDDISQQQGLRGAITIRSDSVIRIGTTLINKPQWVVGLAPNEVTVDASGIMNGTLNILARAQGDLTRDDLPVHFDTLTVGLRNGFLWQNDKALDFIVDNIGTHVKRAGFYRKSSSILLRNQQIVLSGTISSSAFDSLSIALLNFPVNDINALVSSTRTSKELQALKGVIKEAHLTARGPFSDPVFTAEVDARNMMYENASMNNLAAQLVYSHENLSGWAEFAPSAAAATDSSERLRIDIASLPVDLSFQNAVAHGALDTKPIDITIYMKRFTVGYLDPFLPSVSRIAGTATGSLAIGGTLAHINYGGAFNVDAEKFLVEGNNLYYKASAELLFTRDTLTVARSTIIPLTLTRQNGKGYLVPDSSMTAQAEGKIFFKGFSIEAFDLNVTSSRMIVMGAQSQDANSSIYGNLILATGEHPGHFFGTLSEPQLEGDFIAVRADLIFPPVASRAREGRDIKYKFIDDRPGRVEVTTSTVQSLYDTPANIYEGLTETDSQQTAANNIIQTEPSFLDRMRYNLSIDVTRSVRMTIDFGTTEQLVAGLEGQLHFSRNDEGKNALVGVLNVVDATYKFYRSFPARGTLTFFGEVDNPQLDITATLKDKHQNSNGVKSDVAIIMDIKGTRKEPKLVYSIEVDGVAKNDTQDEINADATLFILTGRFKEDYSKPELVQTAVSAVLSTTSTTLSAGLTSLLQSTGLIKNIDVTPGSDHSDSQVKLALEWQEYFLQIDSHPTTDPGGTNVSIEVPVTVLWNNLVGANVDKNFGKGLVVKIERRTGDPNAISTTPSTTSTAYGVLHLGYKITF